MRIGLLGKKIGMTRVYDAKGRATAVTVIDVSGNAKLQVKTKESDGYNAVQVGYDTQKESRVNNGELGVFKKHESEPKKLVREFRLEEDAVIAGDLNLTPNLFQAGQLVDVIGQSKGKGFQGVHEEAQHGRPACVPRFDDASPERRHRQPLDTGPRLQEHGDAGSSWETSA